MPELLENLFFPSRQKSPRLEKENFLDVEEATGAPRLTNADAFGPESRNGLFCANNPVNWSDPSGLGNKLDGQGDGEIPEAPRIIVTAPYLPNPLDNPSVRIGPTGGPGGGGGGRGGENGGQNHGGDSTQAAAPRSPEKGEESLYDCLNRHAQEKYGDALQLSDNLGLYGLGAYTYTTIAGNLLSSAAQSATTSVITNAPLAGVRQGGSIPERMFAADEAAALAGRLSTGRAVIGVLSKASGVITFGASAFSIGARLEFLADCRGGGG